MSDGVYIWPPTASMYPLSYAFCIEMVQMVSDSIAKALASGVQSYHVGSRSLSRYSLTELSTMLAWWMNRANDALWGSSIKVRRGVPTDCMYGC